VSSMSRLSMGTIWLSSLFPVSHGLRFEYMFNEFDSMFRDVEAAVLDEAKDRVMGNKVQFAIHCRFKKVTIGTKTREPEIKFDDK